MTFREDILKFLLSLLAGLGSLLLADNFLVDRSRTIFSMSTEGSFESFVIIFFILPYLIFSIILLVLKSNEQLTRIKTALFISLILLFLYATTVFSFELEINITLLYAYLILHFILIFIYTRTEHKFKSVDFSFSKRIIVEFCFITVFLIVLGFTYTYNNKIKAKKPEYFTKKDLPYIVRNIKGYSIKNDDLRKGGKVFFDDSTNNKGSIIEIEEDLFGTNNDNFFLRIDSIVSKMESDPTLKDNNNFKWIYEKYNLKWTYLINQKTFNGLSILLVCLGVLLPYWLILNLLNDQRRRIEFTKEYATIESRNNNKYEVSLNTWTVPELLAYVRVVIVITVSLILPFLYVSNSKKDLYDKPFFNLTSSEQTLVVPQPDAENDSILVRIKENRLLLEGIWSDQKYYQERFRSDGDNDLVAIDISPNLEDSIKLKTHPLKRDTTQ